MVESGEKRGDLKPSWIHPGWFFAPTEGLGLPTKSTWAPSRINSRPHSTLLTYYVSVHPAERLALRDNPLEDLVGRAFLGRLRLGDRSMFPYPVDLGRRGVTGCSEGCAVIQSGLAGMSERLVVAHYHDSCVPWVDLGLSWMNLEGRVD